MEILNYINGEWIKPNVTEYFDVINPATGQVIAKTPFSSKADVDAAAKAAATPSLPGGARRSMTACNICSNFAT